MKIWVLSLFPDYFIPLQQSGVVGQALRGERELEVGQVSLEVVELRRFSPSKYGAVDDYPYGGGEGMVMRADVLARALEEGVRSQTSKKLHVIYLSPQGKRWDQSLCRVAAKKLVDYDVVLICGRYEGVDQRFIDRYVDEEISLGDFIVSGGEIAAMAWIDSVVRTLPGTLGNTESAVHESFESGLLEGPVYTRPALFEGLEVPAIYRSGDHAKIAAHRLAQAQTRTQQRRADLWEDYCDNA